VYNKNLLDISFGCAGLKDDMFKQHFQRIPMENDGRTAENIIKFEYLYYILKKLAKKNAIKR